VSAGRPFRRRFYDPRSQRAGSLNRQVSGQSVTQDGRHTARAWVPGIAPALAVRARPCVPPPPAPARPGAQRTVTARERSSKRVRAGRASVPLGRSVSTVRTVGTHRRRFHGRPRTGRDRGVVDARLPGCPSCRATRRRPSFGLAAGDARAGRHHTDRHRRLAAVRQASYPAADLAYNRQCRFAL
jgi:hypothetical protein